MQRSYARSFVALVLTVFEATTDVAAEATTRIPRIGWLGHSSASSGPLGYAGDFQQGLRDLGYVVGQNVTIEYRYANGDVSRLPDLASELVRLRVDIIVTSGEPSAFAAKRATNEIPVIITELGVDPVKAGLVASLGRPEGNVTGLASQSEELWQKRLGLLKEIAPKVSRLAVIWNPDNPANASCVDEIKSVAPTLSMHAGVFGVRDANELQLAFSGIVAYASDAVVVCWDSVTLEHAKGIADFALKQRMPTIAPLREYAKAGALLSFGMSLPVQRRRSAYYVDRILKGAKPSSLPIERPTTFELIVNKTTAKALGLSLPMAIEVLADGVE